jgi:putative ABC transport system permease protein
MVDPISDEPIAGAPITDAELRERTLGQLANRRQWLQFSAIRVSRIALRSLFHQKGKLLSALAGVSFSATLALAQIGIYVGFLDACSGLITHAGADVWVMARGTQALDFGRPLPESTRAVVASLACVQSVRGLLTSFVPVQKTSRGDLNAFMVGFEHSEAILPWSLAAGLPSDLHAPLRVAIDEADMKRLELPPEPLGVELRVNGEEARVAAITSGVRSFTLSPYMFAEIENVRRFAGVADGQSSYWLAEVKDAVCVPEVIDRIQRNPELQAFSSQDFRAKTEAYWINGSGAGIALGFSTVLSVVVGCIIVAQTLYTIAKDHERELAGMKAMGATQSDLVAFVQVQAGVLALVGVAVGFVGAMGAARLAATFGLSIVLSPRVILAGAAAIFGMCAVATIASSRVVLKVDPCALFR